MSTSIVVFTLLAFAQSRVDDPMPPLDRLATKKLLRRAERELVAYRLSNPLESRRVVTPDMQKLPGPGHSGSRVVYPDGEIKEVPNIIEHRGNPLVGRICEFRFAYKMTTLATDAVRKQHDDSRFTPGLPVTTDHVARAKQFVIHGLIDASLEESYPFEKVHAEQHEALQAAIAKVEEQIDEVKHEREELGRGVKWDRRAGRLPRRPDQYYELDKRERKLMEELKDAKDRLVAAIGAHRQTLSELKHELRIILPYDYRPPDKMPRNIEAHVSVAGVEWNRAAPTPTFIIYADLIKAEDLNLNAVGVIREPISP